MKLRITKGALPLSKAAALAAKRVDFKTFQRLTGAAATALFRETGTSQSPPFKVFPTTAASGVSFTGALMRAGIGRIASNSLTGNLGPTSSLAL